MAWSFYAIEATLSMSSRLLDGVEVHDNLTHWLISTQVDGERRQGRVEFWDRGRGWGRISLDGDARRTRIFVHARDVASAKKQLPRGGRVDLRLRSSERGWCGEDVRLLDATDDEVDALLGAAAMALGPDEPPASTEPSRPVTP